MITIVGKDNLEDFIWQSHKENKITVIYFGAIWCGPCQMLKDKLNSDEAKSGKWTVDVLDGDIVFTSCKSKCTN